VKLLRLEAILLAGLLPLAAQEFRATISGRALDPHDAPIAGALVTIRNAGTNAIQQTRTDAKGSYSAAFLQPGDYSITVEVAGFKKAVREGISLTIGQAATLDVRLELGAVPQKSPSPLRRTCSIKEQPSAAA
jgi:Cna protein B-type domain.